MPTIGEVVLWVARQGGWDGTTLGADASHAELPQSEWMMKAVEAAAIPGRAYENTTEYKAALDRYRAEMRGREEAGGGGGRGSAHHRHRAV